MTRENCVGIDLGGTKILAGVVSKRGKVLARAKTKTPFAAGNAAVGDAIVATVAEALAGAGGGRPFAIGVGSPGPIDPDRGIVLRTPNIAVKNLKICELLSKRFGVPVVLDNDVHMALWGELRCGAGRGHRDLVGIWVGTGIGGGVIVDGRLVRGINKNAGEIGHMILDARRAGPGSEGTLEWEASKTGIARLLEKWIRRGEKTSLRKQIRKKDRLDSSALGTACRKGDGLARRAVEHSARYVGIAVADLFNVLSPEIFILGGGVVEDVGRTYISSVRRTAREFAFSTELATVQIEAAKLGSDSGVIGAALAARERFQAPADQAKTS
jgi:glucokinase